MLQAMSQPSTPITTTTTTTSTTKSPLEQYLESHPDLSNNPTRLSALFAAFPPKQTRPAVWRAQFQFWERIVHDAVTLGLVKSSISSSSSNIDVVSSNNSITNTAGNTSNSNGICYFDIGQFIKDAKCHGRTPLGLSRTVLRELESRRIMVSLQVWSDPKSPIHTALNSSSMPSKSAPSSSSSSSISLPSIAQSSDSINDGTGSTGNSNSNETWGSWMLKALVQKPLQTLWGGDDDEDEDYETHSSMMSNTSTNDSTTTPEWKGIYIYTPLVQSIAEKLLTHHYATAHSITDGIYTFPEFYTKFAQTCRMPDGRIPTELDISIVIDYLVSVGEIRKKRVDEDKNSNSPSKTLLKMKLAHHKGTDVRLEDITKIDIGIVHIKEAITRLEHQIEELTTTHDSLTRQAKTYKAKQMIPQALHCLKRRKMVSDVLSKRLGPLDTLNAILLSIQNADTEAQILKSYEVGSATLSSFLKSHDLSVERVNETMDTLADTLADQRELEEAIAVNNDLIQQQAGLNVDEEELEMELDELLRQQQEEGMVRRVETALPDVPLSGLEGLTIHGSEEEEEEDAMGVRRVTFGKRAAGSGGGTPRGLEKRRKSFGINDETEERDEGMMLAD